MGKSKIHSFKLFIPTIFLLGSLIGGHSTAQQFVGREGNAYFQPASVSNNSVCKAFYSVTSRRHGGLQQHTITHVGSFQCTLEGGQTICQPKVCWQNIAITFKSLFHCHRSAMHSPCKIDAKHETGWREMYYISSEIDLNTHFSPCSCCPRWRPWLARRCPRGSSSSVSPPSVSTPSSTSAKSALQILETSVESLGLTQRSRLWWVLIHPGKAIVATFANWILKLLGKWPA